MMNAQKISAQLHALADKDQAQNLSRFFKCGKGEYGEGDRFLGVKVPQTRQIVKKNIPLADTGDVDLLTRSIWHEERLAGFLLLVELYTHASGKKGSPERAAALAEFYYNICPRGNNWDLVDLIAPKILGDRLSRKCDDAAVQLTKLSMSGNLWMERAAVVGTLPLIRQMEFDLTLQLCAHFLAHPHDLIHKATGWMLREIGKRDEKAMTGFIDRHYSEISRTTLRYAIEKLPEEKRRLMLRRDDSTRVERRGKRTTRANK